MLLSLRIPFNLSKALVDAVVCIETTWCHHGLIVSLLWLHSLFVWFMAVLSFGLHDALWFAPLVLHGMIDFMGPRYFILASYELFVFYRGSGSAHAWNWREPAAKTYRPYLGGSMMPSPKHRRLRQTKITRSENHGSRVVWRQDLLPKNHPPKFLVKRQMRQKKHNVGCLVASGASTVEAKTLKKPSCRGVACCAGHPTP